MLDFNKNVSSDEMFLPLDGRRSGGAYFYRVSGSNDKIKKIITDYYGAALKKGAVLVGKLKTPDERQVTFFLDMLGRDFSLDKMFIGRSLSKWLPRLKNDQCVMLTDAIHDTLIDFRSLGKNEAMLKNLYVRLMCWLYFILGSVVTHIGENEPPKILYGGAVGRHDLYFLHVMNRCGCDVLFLQTNGEQEYDVLDPGNKYSQRLTFPDMQPFPQGFDVTKLKNDAAEKQQRESLYGARTSIRAGTNIWLSGDKILEDLKIVPVSRGKDSDVFYNSLCRITGVWDKLTYQNDLYSFYMEMKNSGRRMVLIENRIPMPTNEELIGVERGPFKTKEQVVAATMKSVRLPVNDDLKKVFARAFVDVILEEGEKPDMTIQRLSTMAACVSCWLNRYGPPLFNSWTMPMVSLFIYLGGCRSGHEEAFLRVLSRLPCDVLILAPNLNVKCLLNDSKLFELKYADSLNVTEFPTDSGMLQFATVAYHAERELDSALYEGTGLYRDYQYTKANSVILKTMFEEIDILWKQETKFRPNFGVIDGVVNVPVIFAKVSGVKESNVTKYWKTVQNLLTDNTLVIYGAPFIRRGDFNPMNINSAAYIRGGRIRRDYVLSMREYQYRHLRRETQDFIFDKIDLLMGSRLISGTFENGTEYLIAATLLNIPPDILKLIQGFDFTKLNPKIIYINTAEVPISLEDAILTAFLSLSGFDVLFLVPPGYQTVENYFSKHILDEHKVGEYMYDLQMPRLKPPKTSVQKSKPIFGGLFRKGQ